MNISKKKNSNLLNRVTVWLWIESLLTTLKLNFAMQTHNPLFFWWCMGKQMFYFNYTCWIYCCTNIKNIKSIRTGFDLTTRDSYFTILVEVFTDHILAEKIYFKNHIEWTEHKIMVVNRQVSAKLFDNEIISKTFLSTISTIIHFFIKQRFL